MHLKSLTSSPPPTLADIREFFSFSLSEAQKAFAYHTVIRAIAKHGVADVGAYEAIAKNLSATFDKEYVGLWSCLVGSANLWQQHLGVRFYWSAYANFSVGDQLSVLLFKHL